MEREKIIQKSALLGNEEEKLHRHLGPLQVIMLGIGCIIGAGIFSITGVAAADNAGPAIIISFLIACIGCVGASLCYSELASMIPVSGSAYSYSYAAFGEFVAWVIGWDLILEYAIGCATVAISWSAYVVSFLHDRGIHIPDFLVASPWQPFTHSTGVEVYGFMNLPALLILVGASCILILGIKESATINAVIVILKVSVIILFIGVGYFYVDSANYHPFIPPNTGVFGEFGWSGIFRGAAVVFFAYIGFDAVSTVAQETKNPKRDMPIGIIGSLAICTILYILFSSVLLGVVNYKEINLAAPVISAVDYTPYPWLKGLVKLAIVCGLSSVILVLLLGQSRIMYAMSSDGFLPPVFSRTLPYFKTPWIANLSLMAFVGGIAAFVPIQIVGHLTSIGTLFAFILVCGGVLILRYRHPEIDRPFRTPWVPFIPIFGIVICLLMMFSLDVDTWIRLFVWMVIGLAIYYFYGRHRVASVQRERKISS